MAVQWSSENVVAEHRDLQANAMALDYKGELTLLAGRRYLALVSLDNPSIVIKRVNRVQQKYDVTAAEWNPTPSQGHTFALASGEKAEISAWTEGNLTGVTSLSAHTRTISDLNWHRFDPNLLATCSVDTFVHIWDTRETRKPVTSMPAIAGASQVKWNKVNGHLLASGHDCDIRIWDSRKPGQPIQYIAAHLSKIQGLDWSHTHEYQLVTSSNDCRVKFFDVQNPKIAEIMINTLLPVWRVKYTPFGEGVVTVVVPQLRRGENSLLLWNLTDVSAPVHTFVGHSDIVLEFEWKQNNSVMPANFQLVTWARDHSLRIWKIDQHLQKVCGHEEEKDSVTVNQNSELNPELSSFPDVPGTGSSAKTIDCSWDFLGCTEPQLNEPGISYSSSPSSREDQVLEDVEAVTKEEKPELAEQSAIFSSETTCEQDNLSLLGSSLGTYRPPIQTSLQQELADAMATCEDHSGQWNYVEVTGDADRRTCQVTVRQGGHTVCLNIIFPPTYPRNHAPLFQFTIGTNLNQVHKLDLLKVIKSTASQQLQRRKPCLDRIITVLLHQLKVILEEELSVLDGSVSTNSYGLLYSHKNYGSYQDHSVPFPRTSGARFCSAGVLVCFARPTFLRKGSSRTEASTPRSLSALGAYIANFMPQIISTMPTSPSYNYMYSNIAHSPTVEPNVSISNYYYQDRKMKAKRNKGEDENGRFSKAGSVIVYDISCLMSFSVELARTYSLDGQSIIATCLHNREAAAAVGRKDLVQVWSLAASTCALSIHSPEEARDNDNYSPWTHHPFGRTLINTLLDYYISRYDVQTAATLSCVFGIKTESVTHSFVQRGHFEAVSNGNSPYNTIHTATNNVQISDYTALNFRSKSMESLPKLLPANDLDVAAFEATDLQQATVSRYLDNKRLQQYDMLRSSYADILYRWNLLQQRSMVLKYIQISPALHKGAEFQVDCSFCQQSAKEPRCSYCGRYSFNCSVCHVSVKGASSFCIVCGHGGHAHHLLQWFQTHSECPTGCGCNCISEMDLLFK